MSIFLKICSCIVLYVVLCILKINLSFVSLFFSFLFIFQILPCYGASLEVWRQRIRCFPVSDHHFVKAQQKQSSHPLPLVTHTQHTNYTFHLFLFIYSKDKTLIILKRIYFDEVIVTHTWQWHCYHSNSYVTYVYATGSFIVSLEGRCHEHHVYKIWWSSDL